jgi:GH35 family endo-1,4-beta-xylanase
MHTHPSRPGRLGAALRLAVATAACLLAAGRASAQQNVIENSATLGVVSPAAATYNRVLGANADQTTYDITVTAAGTNGWDALLQTTNTRRINKGDTLVLDFSLRSEDADAAKLVVADLAFERAASPFTRSFGHRVTTFRFTGGGADGNGSRRYRFPFMAAETYEIGEAKFSIRLAQQPQRVFVSGLRILNHGSVNSLSATDGFAQAVLPNLWQPSPGESNTTVAVSHPFFSTAYEYKTTRVVGQAQHNLVVPITRNINVGDVLVLFCYLNDADSATDDPDNTRVPYVTAGIEKAAGPYDTDRVDLTLFAEPRPALNVAPTWRQLAVPFIAPADYVAGSTSATRARLFFKLGNDKPQTIRIAGVRLVNLGAVPGYLYTFEKTNGTPVTQTTLGTTVSYGGAAHNAAWRAEAASRIDTHRKARLTINLIGADGVAVPSSSYTTTQTAHAFPFGSAVGRKLIGTDADASIYRSRVAENFNRSALENDLKWTSWYWPANRPFTVSMLTQLRALGIWDIRGHTLVWPGTKNLPEPITQLSGAALRDAVLQHIQDTNANDSTVGIGNHPDVVGRISEWDVLNEPWNNNWVQANLQSTLNQSRAVTEASWFTRAAAADPRAKRFLNDFGIQGGPNADRHRSELVTIINNIVAAGGPIEGVGIQSHIGSNPPDILDFKKSVDTFSAIQNPAGSNLLVSVTEYDHSGVDLQLQADYLRDYMTMAFSLPAMTGFSFWNFWDGDHWKDDASLYYRDWSLKPAGRVFRELVLRKWMHGSSGSTSTGTATPPRLFRGDHRIAVTTGGTTRTYHTRLDRDRTVFLPVGASLPWVAGVDIGAPLAAGSTAVSSTGQWTLHGSGILHGRADNSHVTTKLVGPTAALHACVQSLRDGSGGTTNLDQWAKAGVIVRQSLAADAPYFAALATPNNGLIVQYRTLHGGTTTASQLTGVVPPVYVRIVRNGDSFTAQYKKNGPDAWINFGPANVPVPMQDQAHGGLVLSSNKHGSAASNLARAVFHTFAIP